MTREAVRRRVQRGTLESRREVVGNRVRWLVRLPLAGPEAPPLPQPGAGPLADPLVLLERHVADLRGEVAYLRAELERRRWPGLWPALRRFWRGDETWT